MSRDEAYQLLTTYIKNKNLLKHCLACEAAMKGLYQRLTPEKERSSDDEIMWGITGLLHDIDYELAQQENKLEKHGQLLFGNHPTEKVELPEKIEHAIRAHNYHGTGTQPESQMDWAITCVDQLTGLIVAAALVRPDKKLEGVTTETVLKRFGEKAFAKGASREEIKGCEEHLGLPL